MRLFIAEKPKMGGEIAKALPGPHVRKQGYVETGGGLVTWCIGHLLEQLPPDAYDPKYEKFPGQFADLPVVPAQWKLKVAEGKSSQVSVIKALLKQCTEVVNAGDPGREGQLIIDEVLDYLGNKKPVVRLLLPSLDAPTVRKAIAQMAPNGQFASLYQAALCRQRADWLVGMNLTRSYTILGQKQGHRGVLSVGRVQTPTLAIVVRRDEEIESFVPTHYWSLHALCDTRKAGDAPFWTVWVPPGRDAASATAPEPEPDADEEDESEGDGEVSGQGGTLPTSAPRPAWLDEHWRIVDQREAERIARAIRQAATATVVRDERKSAQEPPPMPFELTGLQAKINAQTGASVDDVLKACQSLYEAGHASYPRSDCPYLPTAIFGDAAAVLAAIGAGMPALAALAQGANPTLQSRAWNDAKVGEHYGIIPTSSAPNFGTLSTLEKAVYEAIARRYLAQFYPPCLVDKALIELESAGERLVARGRIITSPGWRVVFDGVADEAEGADGKAGGKGSKDKPAEPPLPMLIQGQGVGVNEVRVDSHTTKPPPRFTEGTLTMAMKHVHRLVKDPMERKKLKVVEGIGRSATRAAIIQTLLKRTFLLPEGKKIKSSPAARVLVHALPPPLVDPGLTARWEQALDTVAQGKATLDAFMGKQVQWVNHLVRTAETVVLPPLPATPSTNSATGAATGGARAAGKRGGTAQTGNGGPAGFGGGRASGTRSSGARGKGSSTRNPGAAKAAAPAAGNLDGTTCPKCGKGTLRARTVRQGQHQGKTFYGCSAYPACNHSVWPR